MDAGCLPACLPVCSYVGVCDWLSVGDQQAWNLIALDESFFSKSIGLEISIYFH